MIQIHDTIALLNIMKLHFGITRLKFFKFAKCNLNLHPIYSFCKYVDVSVFCYICIGFKYLQEENSCCSTKSHDLSFEFLRLVLKD